MTDPVLAQELLKKEQKIFCIRVSLPSALVLHEHAFDLNLGRGPLQSQVPRCDQLAGTNQKLSSDWQIANTHPPGGESHQHPPVKL